MEPDRSVVEVHLQDGTTISAVALDYGGAGDVSALDHLDFSGVTDAIETVARSVKASIDTIKPDTASVEFGVQVAVKSGRLTGLLVEGSGQASLKVTLGWGSHHGNGRLLCRCCRGSSTRRQKEPHAERSRPMSSLSH